MDKSTEDFIKDNHYDDMTKTNGNSSNLSNVPQSTPNTDNNFDPLNDPKFAYNGPPPSQSYFDTQTPSSNSTNIQIENQVTSNSSSSFLSGGIPPTH